MNNGTHNFKKLSVQTLGVIKYKDAYILQKKLQKQRIQEKICDTLLLLEHPNVITLGTRGTLDDILVQSEILQENNVEIERVERGGQATIHSPGQLVGYFIFHLYRKRMALREFIGDIEQSLINTLLAFGIPAAHGKNERGVWVANAKIASIGISVSRGVSMHGFALNVCNKLDVFNWIIPCGMPERKMTNMLQEFQKMNHHNAGENVGQKNTPTIQEVQKILISKIMEKIHYKISV